MLTVLAGMGYLAPALPERPTGRVRVGVAQPVHLDTACHATNAGDEWGERAREEDDVRFSLEYMLS